MYLRDTLITYSIRYLIPSEYRIKDGYLYAGFPLFDTSISGDNIRVVGGDHRFSKRLILGWAKGFLAKNAGGFLD